VPRLLTCLTLLLASACRAGGVEQLERFEFEHAQMGTLFRLALYAPDAQRAEDAAAAAFSVLDELDARLSDYDADSELSRLSAASEPAAPTEWIRVSRDLGRVLARAKEISAASEGAFDVTCGNATRLWRRAIRERELPAADALAAALSATDWRAVELAPDAASVRLLRRGMRLDLGGIAKGHALDRMLATLREQGVDRALVDGGGDLAASGAPPNSRGWIVQVRSGFDASDEDWLVLREEAVATSGDAFRHVDLGGRRFSHLVDPSTGQGSVVQCAATVIARDGISADALATAACVMGQARVELLWSRFPEAEIRLLDLTKGQASTAQSPGFSARLGRE